jgi:glycerophosphoryl diester phosphodiesterase
VQVIGHRGARGMFPENTLDGFRAAAALGVSAFELDVGMTCDGVVVVCHDQALDPDLTRDAAGAWLPPPGPLLRSLTMAELTRYDVGRSRPGSPVNLRFRHQKPHDGARIPALETVLAAMPDAIFIIEIKTDPQHPHRSAPPVTVADGVLAVIDRTEAAERVVLESFDWRVQRHVARIRPDIRLAWLTRADTARQRSLWWDLPHLVDDDRSAPEWVAAASSPADTPIWAPDHASLTEDLVHQAHTLGLIVIPWTVNNEQDIRRLAGWRVDGLISDRPDLVLARLRPVKGITNKRSWPTSTCGR